MKSEKSLLTREQVGGFTKLVANTRDREFNCSECLHHVSEFSERQLNGQPLDEALALVEHHLELCPECREEWVALMEILEAGR